MILLYRVLINFLYPFSFIILYLRTLIKKEDPKRYKEKILVKHFNVVKSANKKLCWFHAASIGELKSILPIIKKLDEKNEIFEFLITTTTLSSSQIAKIELKKFNNIQHRFMPLDVNYLIEKFLVLWKPEKIFLVDSEIWPNLILKAREHKIPIALINARLTKKSYRRWFSFLSTSKKIFSIFDLCLCANEETKDFLKKLEAKNIKYFGNIKLINEINKNDYNNQNSQMLSKIRFWFAASTHKEEDIFCLNTHIQLKKQFSDVITIIAPRHINRVRKIKLLAEKLSLKAQIISHNDLINKDFEIIIIDSFGVLNFYYKYAKSVFIGKSIIKRLKNDGGQNPIDAANFNCKIYHGPYVSNFFEIYEILKKNNISKEIKNYSELSKNLLQDLNNCQKKINNNSNIIKNLGEEVLINTSKSLESFLYDKV